MQQITCTATKGRMYLFDLVHYLAYHPFTGQSIEWHDWLVTKVDGGLNNRVYRAESVHGAHDEPVLAIKLYIRDARDRAGREFGALQRLQHVAPGSAPRPLLLERFDSDPRVAPVVVQTWLSGEVSATPPDTDADWQRLVGHLQTVHAVQQRTDWAMPAAVLTMSSAADGLREIDAQVHKLPAEARPAELLRLQSLAHHRSWPSWPVPKQYLCRGDTNTSNFVRRPNSWASVDWEYAGWGDPAFEVADLMTMPPYQDVDAGRWDWVLNMYVSNLADVSFVVRVQTYRRLMLVWWVARLARWLYEMPRQLDQRLAQQGGRPALYTQDQQQEKLERYIIRAQHNLIAFE